MLSAKKIPAKNLALIACFAALYAVFSFMPIFQILGASGKAITIVAIISPIFGVILGSTYGFFSAFLGGLIVLYINPAFSLPSLVSGITSALFAGLLCEGKRFLSSFLYLLLLLTFGIYPSIGPIWLYPLSMWFQILGFILLISPLSNRALEHFRADERTKKVFSFFFVTLLATLAGQIAGSLSFELIYWPNLITSRDVWKGTWQLLAMIYPLERIIITLASTFIGTSLYQIMKLIK